MIDLPRAPAGTAELTGTMTRRYEQGATLCPIATAARLHTCARDRAVLEVAPPPAPTSFEPCAAPPAPPVTWTLDRER